MDNAAGGIVWLGYLLDVQIFADGASQLSAVTTVRQRATVQHFREGISGGRTSQQSPDNAHIAPTRTVY